MTEAEIIQQASKIQGWLMPEEMHGLYVLAEQYIEPHGEVLEVGSWKGKSSFILASVCAEKQAHLTCLDTFIGTDLNEAHYKEALDMGAQAFMEANIVKNLEGLPVSYVVGDSLQLHTEFHDESFELVFIDGNHCDPVVSQDLKNYYPKVKDGKIFVCHDYSAACPDVRNAIDKKFNYEGIDCFYRSLVGIIKKPGLG